MSFENFETLEQEKKQRILNAALEEFTKNGYKKASTIEIAKNASISKGALFHYFGTKEALFHYLISYAVQNLEEEVLAKSPVGEMNLIEHYQFVTQVKYDMYKESPYLFDFLYRCLQDDEVRGRYFEEISGVVDRYKQLMQQSLQYTHFKEGIDLEQAVKLSTYLFEGLAVNYARAHSELDLDEIVEEGLELLELLGELILEES